ncbi:MAG TPA: TIGR02587 family membrane protein [Skermanella sp.]|nr:TIGR02587 family membrane protein [Skermanella sp.]
MAAGSTTWDPKANREFAIASARAFGGAIIFSLPLMMTMEMWWLGFYMDRFRLVLFLVLTVPVLAVLSHYAGFERADGPLDLVLDAFTALAVGFIASAFILVLLHVLQAGNSPDELIGKIVLQAIPGAIGAMLARSQLGTRGDDENSGDDDPNEEVEEARRDTYAGELFLAGIGAMFMAFNVAPTDEMVLIGLMMTEWHAIALVAGSLLLMHAFVYAVEFRGTTRRRDGVPLASEFLRLTMVAYVLSLLISLYVLWTFGRTDGLGLLELVKVTLVLGFPAALGAAAARLIL